MPSKPLPVKRGQRSVRRRSAVPNLKIIFPLLMRRAARRAFPIVRSQPLPRSGAAGEVSAHRKRAGRSSGLHPPRNGKGAARPFQTPKRKSNRKKSSRFAQTGCGAQRPLRALSGTRVLLTAAPTAPPCIRRWRRSSPLHFFLASPIDRPLSRCGGSSPQGSGSALSVTFGDTLSPFCRSATSSPDRGKSFKGRGKKRSLHGLGSPFGRAGAKRLRGFVLPQAATDAK